MKPMVVYINSFKIKKTAVKINLQLIPIKYFFSKLIGGNFGQIINY